LISQHHVKLLPIFKKAIINEGKMFGRHYVTVRKVSEGLIFLLDKAHFQLAF
jgi:hypothetical protein